VTDRQTDIVAYAYMAKSRSNIAAAECDKNGDNRIVALELSIRGETVWMYRVISAPITEIGPADNGERNPSEITEYTVVEPECNGLYD